VSAQAGPHRREHQPAYETDKHLQTHGGNGGDIGGSCEPGAKTHRKILYMLNRSKQNNFFVVPEYGTYRM
jgi:hypothetical protein